jgi:hypothetical protein
MFGAASLAVCIACGGGGGGNTNTTGSATVNGTVGGLSLPASDAVSNVVAVSGQTAGAILISSTANACATISANNLFKNAQVLLISIGTQNAGTTTAPSSPGTYPVFSSADSISQTGKVAVAVFVATNSLCMASPSEGISGTVTLTRVDSTGYAGTFDITFSGGTGQLTGSFTTALCTPLNPNSGSGGHCV